MRRASKIDDNQTAIVDAFRRLSFAVSVTSTVGQGFPDLVVSSGNRTWLIEVKDGSKSPSRQRLTADQIKFHEAWQAEIPIITSVDEAIEWCNQRRKE